MAHQGSRSGEKGPGFAYRRALALRFIATSTIFTAVASTLGMLKLLSFGGMFYRIGYSTFSVHPYMQLLGFLSMFVMGVAYALLPYFRNSDLSSRFPAELSYFSSLAGSVAYIGAQGISQSPERRMVLIAGSALLILAFLAYSYELSYLLRKKDRNLAESRQFFFIFPFAMIISQFMAIMSVLRGTGILTMPFLYAVLDGGFGSMIFGVALRMVALRFTMNRPYAARAAAALQFSGVVAAFAESALQIRAIETATFSIFLISAAIFIFGSRSLERSRLLLTVDVKKEGGFESKFPHLLFSERSQSVAVLWLLAGTVSGVVYATALDGADMVRIAFIHSLGIGFIGTFIMGYAPMLFPGILGRKKPSEKHSSLPVYGLTAGTLLFVAGDYAAALFHAFPVWAAPAGIIILASIGLFLYDTHQALI